MSKRRAEISLVESDSDDENKGSQKRIKTNKVEPGKLIQMGSKGVNSPSISKKDTTFGVVTNQPKKLVIKNMKAAPKLPENFEEETWKKLQQAVLIIFSTNVDGPSTSTSANMQMGYSVEELYKAVEDLCSHKMGGNLYQRLQTQCEEHVKVISCQLTGESSATSVTTGTAITSLDNITYLSIVNSAWVLFCKQLIMIRSIFLYLDRTYVLQQLNANSSSLNLSSSNGTNSVKSIWEMGMYIWRKYVALNSYILPKCIEALISLIQRERGGETVDRSLVKSMVRMYISLQIYGEVFEVQFLENTQKYYEQEGSSIVKDRETADYLRHVELRLNEENERVLHYLDASTRKLLISIVDKYLIYSHLDSIISKGFDSLMDLNRTEDLKRLYSLFARVNIPSTLLVPSSSIVNVSISGGSLDKLKLAFKAYIKTTGTLLVNDPEKEPTMVQEILNLKTKMDGILENAFYKNESFVYALKEAFEGFINSRANKPAELIAKYLDSLLRSGSKSARAVASNEDELESVMDKVIVIFRYIQGKDIFEAFYKKELAKRLLLGKSQSLDAEKSMISKLKSECGSSFTTKLEGMFKDINISKDLMDAFRSQLSEAPIDIEMNVHVLTQGYWPPYPKVEITLPTELSFLQEKYKSFYLSKHNGRKVTWQNSLGQCLVRSFFPIAKKELQLSLFQTVVLLTFNDPSATNGLSFKDIKERVGIDKEELSRTLLSLASGKVKVLLKSSTSPDSSQTSSQDNNNSNKKETQIDEDDVFTFNKSFKHKLFRIKVNTIQLKETVEENQKTTASVFQDRQYQIDAAIVRIMKTRKSLNHQQLVAELYQQLKFPVKPADLKKRIESLLDREYLERDNENSQIYRYLA